MDYISQLIDDCITAREAKALSIHEITVESVLELIKELPNLPKLKNVIYIIEQLDGNPAQTYEDLHHYKNDVERSKYKNPEKRKCPKLNEGNKDSFVMYVGSSTKGIKGRINQHISIGHKDTYALNLSHWFNGRCKITFKEYDVLPRVLQIIEDDLSHKLKPAFGKIGGNNKGKH